MYSNRALFSWPIPALKMIFQKNAITRTHITFRFSAVYVVSEFSYLLPWCYLQFLRTWAFNFFIFFKRMYPSILSFEPLTSLSCPLNAVFPGLKMLSTGFLLLKSDPGQESNLKVSTDFCYPTIQRNGTVTYKPRRLPRHQRAQAHNSTPNSRQKIFM
jgi:hypothetical protein